MISKGNVEMEPIVSAVDEELFGRLLLAEAHRVVLLCGCAVYKLGIEG
jgi:hypothetical protein